MGAGGNGAAIDPSSRCAHYWTPDMPPVFANQVSREGNPAIEVLEDLGLFTVPGKYRPDCYPAMQPIRVKTAWRGFTLLPAR